MKILVITFCSVFISSLFSITASSQSHIDIEFTMVRKPDSILPKLSRFTSLYPLEDSLNTSSLKFGGRVNVWVVRRPDAFRKVINEFHQYAIARGATGYKLISYSEDPDSDGFDFLFDIFRMTDSVLKINQSMKPINKVIIFNSTDTAHLDINHSTHYFYPGTWFGFDPRPDETYWISSESGQTRTLRPADLRVGKNWFLYSDQKKKSAAYKNGLFAAGILGGLLGGMIFVVTVSESGHHELKQLDEQRAYLLRKIYKQIPEPEIRIHPKMRQKPTEAPVRK
ncbi:MAG TPA: hypothetical protein PK509_05165 [Catalimonadaceae bacterium]|nr:hypothetical protein [Catalimonadaceae bacterium]